MTYWEYDLNNELCDYIKCIWFFQAENAQTVSEVLRIMPDGCIDLVVQSGETVFVHCDNTKGVIQKGSFLFGPIVKMVDLQPLKGTTLIGVRFYPGAINSFFSTSERFMYRINSVTFVECKGDSWRLLEQRIASIVVKNSKVKAIESYLIKQLGFFKKRSLIIKDSLVTSLTLKSTKNGIEYLSKYFGIGVRQLERKFFQSIGITPQVYMRLVRFQRFVRLYHTTKFTNLTELCYLSGYYDQSHFCKDVKWFTGVSPKKLFQEKSQLINHQ